MVVAMVVERTNYLSSSNQLLSWPTPNNTSCACKHVHTREVINVTLNKYDNLIYLVCVHSLVHTLIGSASCCHGSNVVTQDCHVLDYFQYVL